MSVEEDSEFPWQSYFSTDMTDGLVELVPPSKSSPISKDDKVTSKKRRDSPKKTSNPAAPRPTLNSSVSTSVTAHRLNVDDGRVGNDKQQVSFDTTGTTFVAGTDVMSPITPGDKQVGCFGCCVSTSDQYTKMKPDHQHHSPPGKGGPGKPGGESDRHGEVEQRQQMGVQSPVTRDRRTGRASSSKSRSPEVPVPKSVQKLDYMPNSPKLPSDFRSLSPEVQLIHPDVAMKIYEHPLKYTNVRSRAQQIMYGNSPYHMQYGQRLPGNLEHQFIDGPQIVEPEITPDYYQHGNMKGPAVQAPYPRHGRSKQRHQQLRNGSSGESSYFSSSDWESSSWDRNKHRSPRKHHHKYSSNKHDYKDNLWKHQDEQLTDSSDVKKPIEQDTSSSEKLVKKDSQSDESGKGPSDLSNEEKTPVIECKDSDLQVKFKSLQSPESVDSGMSSENKRNEDKSRVCSVDDVDSSKGYKIYKHHSHRTSDESSSISSPEHHTTQQDRPSRLQTERLRPWSQHTEEEDHELPPPPSPQTSIKSHDSDTLPPPPPAESLAGRSPALSGKDRSVESLPAPPLSLKSSGSRESLPASVLSSEYGVLTESDFYVTGQESDATFGTLSSYGGRRSRGLKPGDRQSRSMEDMMADLAALDQTVKENTFTSSSASDLQSGQTPLPNPDQQTEKEFLQSQIKAAANLLVEALVDETQNKNGAKGSKESVVTEAPSFKQSQESLVTEENYNQTRTFYHDTFQPPNDQAFDVNPESKDETQPDSHVQSPREKQVFNFIEGLEQKIPQYYSSGDNSSNNSDYNSDGPQTVVCAIIHSPAHSNQSARSPRGSNSASKHGSPYKEATSPDDIVLGSDVSPTRVKMEAKWRVSYSEHEIQKPSPIQHSTPVTERKKRHEIASEKPASPPLTPIKHHSENTQPSANNELGKYHGERPPLLLNNETNKQDKEKIPLKRNNEQVQDQMLVKHKTKSPADASSTSSGDRDFEERVTPYKLPSQMNTIMYNKQVYVDSPKKSGRESKKKNTDSGRYADSPTKQKKEKRHRDEDRKHRSPVKPRYGEQLSPTKYGHGHNIMMELPSPYHRKGVDSDTTVDTYSGGQYTDYTSSSSAVPQHQHYPSLPPTNIGKCLVKFGIKSPPQIQEPGHFSHPKSVDVFSNRDIMVLDSENCTLQIFTEKGICKKVYQFRSTIVDAVIWDSRTIALLRPGEIAMFSMPRYEIDSLYLKEVQYPIAMRKLPIPQHESVFVIAMATHCVVYTQAGEFLHTIPRHVSAGNGRYGNLYLKRIGRIAVNPKLADVIVMDNDLRVVYIFGWDGGHKFTIDTKFFPIGPVANPQGISLDRLGNIVIADTFNHRIIQVFRGGVRILLQYHMEFFPNAVVVTKDNRLVVAMDSEGRSFAGVRVYNYRHAVR